VGFEAIVSHHPKVEESNEADDRRERKCAKRRFRSSSLRGGIVAHCGWLSCCIVVIRSGEKVITLVQNDGILAPTSSTSCENHVEVVRRRNGMFIDEAVEPSN